MTHIDQRCANILGATALALGDRLAERAVSADGTSHDAALVALLEYLGGGTISELRAVVGLTHSGCVRLVDRLVGQGRVRREPARDGRSVALVLTREGRARAREIQLARRATVAATLEVLDADEQARLGELCGKLLGALRRSGSSPVAICRFCDGELCGHPDRCPVTLAGAIGA